MNKRARNRLIGVTAIIVIVAAAILMSAGKGGAYSRMVSDVVGDAGVAGERIKVSGSVVEGSWDRKANPMRFEIRDEGADPGPDVPVLKVEYRGGVPSTFGDGVVAMITGEIDDQGVLVSEDMVTKCPSKYTSATKAETVALALSGPTGVPTNVTGYIVTGTIGPVGGEYRFKISDADDGSGDALAVAFEGGLPDTVTDGVQVVIGGSLGEDGIYTATSVSLAAVE